jgi:hypothetical protein
VVFGRKRPSVAQAAEASDWSVSEGVSEGSRLIVRANTAFRQAANRSDYGIRIGVAVPLDDPDESGLPQGAELEELNHIEDTLVARAEAHAVLVCVLTTRSMREFVFHSQTSDWIEPFHRDMQGAIPEHEVQVMAQRDPGWSVYEQIVGG